MSNTYEICDVTVTLPALGSVFRDSVGNEGKRGEKCRVNLYAVHPEWREKGATFEGFMVGRTTFEGYTESPYISTLRIMRPHGYKLVALRVDDRDQPESWESLLVRFVGGIIESGRRYAGSMGVAVEDGDKRVRFLAENFKIVGDPILRAEVRPIGNVAVKTRLSDDMREAVIDAIRESDVFKALQASQDAQASALVTTQQAIEQAATDAIRNALKTGGLLFGMKHQ